MKLTDKQKDAISTHLQTFKGCAGCGEKVINVFDALFELREFNGGDMVIGGDSNLIPLVVLTCERCGMISFYNAMQLGLIGSEKVVRDGSKADRKN